MLFDRGAQLPRLDAFLQLLGKLYHLVEYFHIHVACLAISELLADELVDDVCMLVRLLVRLLALLISSFALLWRRFLRFE